MATPPPQPEATIVQAIFSVCASPQLAAAAIETISTIDGAEFIGQFEEYLNEETRPRFPDRLQSVPGCVALIDCDRDREQALRTMQRLAEIFPRRLHLIAVTANHDADFLLRAMRAGCHDVFSPPLDPKLLTASLQRFRRGASPEQQTSGGGKLLSFYGVKGGVGTTTLVVHLSMLLARKYAKRVLVVDYKHELGHVALHLGLKKTVYHFDELLRNAERLDGDLLTGFVTRHPSGLDVIPSPDLCLPVQEGSPAAITSVLNALRSRYDFVLIDSSLEYRQSYGTITAASDEVVLVCTPDVAALRDLVRRVNQLNLNEGNASKLKVVVNRAASDNAVGVEDIAQSLQFPIAHSIPNSYRELLAALNEGAPIPHTQRNPFNSALTLWAERLLPATSTKLAPAPAKRRSFLSFAH